MLRLLLIVLALSVTKLVAQDSLLTEKGNSSIIQDSIKVHSPRKATIYSAVLPGAGQIYNRKHWAIKVPVIYAGFAYIGYAYQSNHQNYILFRNEYRNRMNVEGYVPEGDMSVFNDSAVQLRRDEYRQYRDMNVFFFALWYGLNVLDASVTAHLLDFDVSDELSASIQPMTFSSPLGWNKGISLRLQF